jgi:hypothetical protein
VANGDLTHGLVVAGTGEYSDGAGHVICSYAPGASKSFLARGVMVACYEDDAENVRYGIELHYGCRSNGAGNVSSLGPLSNPLSNQVGVGVSASMLFAGTDVQLVGTGTNLKTVRWMGWIEVWEVEQTI